MSHNPVRANAKRIFPVLGLPFNGHIALGNGTQWRFDLDLTREGRLSVRIGWGDSRAHIWDFPTDGPIMAEDVAEKLNLGTGDAGNVADLVNDQLELVTERQGYYYSDLLGLGVIMA